MAGLMNLSSVIGQPMVIISPHLVQSAGPNLPMRMQAHSTGLPT